MKAKHLSMIGRTIFWTDDDKTCFVCDSKTANLEYIILDTLAEKLGFEILEFSDYHNEDLEIDGMTIKTSLPQEDFEVYIT